MSSTSNTQATVITGPQGSSDVPVSSPETAFVGSVPSQQTPSVGSVPSQQTSTVGSVPSQQTSSGGSVPSQQESTSGSVPSQQVPPSSSVPTRQPSPTEHGSEEGDLPPPLLPLPIGLVQSGHPSLKTSLDRLKESDFFWPSMIADMSRHVQCCPSCQKTSPVRKPNIPFSGTLWSDRPFSSVHVDTIGPLPKDQQDFSFVLVFVDSFTRYTILVPLTKLNAQESAYALVWNVCAIFGIPLAIHSDNGPEFANAIFRGLCDILAIESSNSVPHYSQSNGLVERRHRDILQKSQKTSD
ncbi:hypothetical protein RCL1_007059 [Eukaryota sp. TZLM3-RCL]